MYYYYRQYTTNLHKWRIGHNRCQFITCNFWVLVKEHEIMKQLVCYLLHKQVPYNPLYIITVIMILLNS